MGKDVLVDWRLSHQVAGRLYCLAHGYGRDHRFYVICLFYCPYVICLFYLFVIFIILVMLVSIFLYLAVYSLPPAYSRVVVFNLSIFSDYLHLLAYILFSFLILSSYIYYIFPAFY